jgi:hypothetical protein
MTTSPTPTIALVPHTAFVAQPVTAAGFVADALGAVQP